MMSPGSQPSGTPGQPDGPPPQRPPAIQPAPMPAPPGGPPFPPPQAGPVSDSSGGRGSRRATVVIAVALVCLLVAGVGAYAAARDYRVNQTTQSCGYGKCIPGLRITTVVDALKERGHKCESHTMSWNCGMKIGLVYLNTWLQTSGESIHSISVTINRMGGDALAGTGHSYLSWFAGLPYRDDPVLIKEIEGWIAEQIDARKDKKATIGDYEYVIQFPREEVVELRVGSKP